MASGRWRGHLEWAPVTFTLDVVAHAGSTMHYACLACRKSFKRPMIVATVNRYATSGQQSASIREAWQRDEALERKCPDCGGKTARMGMDFKAPRKNDLKAWTEVEKFIASGKTYYRGVV